MKKIICLFFLGVLLGCVSTPPSYKTEEECTSAGIYWCDDDGDGVYECQNISCIDVENLDIPNLENQSDLGQLDELSTDVGSVGLPDLGSI